MNIVRIITTVALLMGISASSEFHRETGETRSTNSPIPAPLKQNSLHSYAKLPITFVPNAGQTDARVRFVAQTGSANFYFTSTEAVFVLAGKKKGVVLRLQFVGANSNPAITGAQLTGAKINYLTGNDPTRWHAGLASYEEIVYHDLWPGIDLVFRGDKSDLKYEFHVAPGADPNDIALAYRGAKRLSVDRNGGLRIRTALGVMKDTAPLSFQIINGVHVPVTSGYRLQKNKYGFRVGSYDVNRPLVIDPLVAYSTFLGGGGNDQGLGISVDASANTYITGVTSALNFPTTAGVFDNSFNGGTGDAFITKITDTAIVYSTYLGGSGSDQGNGIAVDATGSAYITGSTASSDFPTTPTAFDAIHNGPTDAFATKLTADGSALMYSSYLGGSLAGCLGGSPNDGANQIAVDSLGNAFVVGTTSSRNFPTTAGAFDTTHSNTSCSTIFVTKLNSNGSALIYSTFLGNSGTGNAIAVAADGSAYVTGNCSPVGFPTTPGAFDTTGQGSDVFVTKFTADGSGLLYSTFLSGSLGDIGNGIAVDADANAYVAGFTDSSDYPTTPGAFDTTIPALHIGQVFITKLNSDGSVLVYSTYLGGSARDDCHGITVDTAGNAYVAGVTSSTNFPTTPGAFDLTFNGDLQDAFLSKLNASGSDLIYSTYFGGGGNDVGFAVAVDNFGRVFVTGTTTSNNFPVTAGAFDTTFNGSSDAFLIKLTNQPPDASSDETTTDEDNAVTLNVLGNDVDPDGDPLLVSDVTQGSNGSVTINADNTLTYSPSPNFNGSDAITYTVTDAFGNTDTANVMVTINPVNDAPVATDGTADSNEDSSVQINFVATDVDNSDLVFSVVSGPGNGTLGPVSGSSIVYTPNANFNGTDSFTFQASDGTAESNIATISISVSPINDPPDAVDDVASTVEDNEVTINVTSNDTDVDVDVLTITGVSQAQHGSVAITNNATAVSYTPTENFFGTDSFTYNISDGNGGTDTATVNVTVTSVNDAPVASDDSYNTPANTTLSVTEPGVLVNDSDIDGDVFSAVLVTGVTNGTLALSTDGSFTYTPNPSFSGIDSFTYSAFDGAANSSPVTVQITVTPPPPLPCEQEGQCFVFEYLGHNTGPTGETTITFKVTNKCKNAVRMVAIGTDSFTRIAPADGSIYTGGLGSYNVGWTRASGNPGFVGIKFEPISKNFKNGAADTFSIVVSNFNPSTTIQVKGVGPTQELFSFLLSQTNCATVAAHTEHKLFPVFIRWMTEVILTSGVFLS